MTDELIAVRFTKREIERSISGLADVLQWLNGFRAALPPDTDKDLPTDWQALREINIKLKNATEGEAT